jgi:hypothetical protein
MQVLKNTLTMQTLLGPVSLMDVKLLNTLLNIKYSNDLRLCM